MAALATIAKTWGKCPSTEEWIRMMRYKYKMEYYSAIKEDEKMSFTAMWMDLASVTLSEVNQTKKEIGDILYIKRNTNALTYKTERDSQTLKPNLWLPGKRDS